jgi:hypothetical protein
MRIVPQFGSSYWIVLNFVKFNQTSLVVDLRMIVSGTSRGLILPMGKQTDRGVPWAMVNTCSVVPSPVAVPTHICINCVGFATRRCSPTGWLLPNVMQCDSFEFMSIRESVSWAWQATLLFAKYSDDFSSQAIQLFSVHVNATILHFISTMLIWYPVYMYRWGNWRNLHKSASTCTLTFTIINLNNISGWFSLQWAVGWSSTEGPSGGYSRAS